MKCIYLVFVLTFTKLISGQYDDRYSNAEYTSNGRQYLPPYNERYLAPQPKYTTTGYTTEYDQRQYSNGLEYQGNEYQAGALPYQESYNRDHSRVNGLVGSSEYQNQYNPNSKAVLIGGSPLSSHYQSRFGQRANNERFQSEYIANPYQRPFQNHNTLARNRYQYQNNLAANGYQYQTDFSNNGLQAKRVYDYLPPQESTYVRSFRSADKETSVEKL